MHPKNGQPGVPTIKDKITSMHNIEHLRCHMASACIGLSLPGFCKPENRRKLSNDILDHMTMNIGEAEIATLIAVSELAVIDS